MQSLELALKELVADFDKLLEDLPDMRRQLHEKLGDVMEKELRGEVSASLNDGNGTIRSWQESVVGSGGGYAATRAIKGETGANSPGAITNYLENGHKIRPRGTVNGKSRYRPRIKVPGAYVSGRKFYARTASRIEPMLIAKSEEFCDKIADKLEGKG